MHSQLIGILHLSGTIIITLQDVIINCIVITSCGSLHQTSHHILITRGVIQADCKQLTSKLDSIYVSSANCSYMFSLCIQSSAVIYSHFGEQFDIW